MPGQPGPRVGAAAFDALYRQLRPRLLGKAALVCGGMRALAHDAVQEAFYECWRRMNDPHAKPVEAWGPWLTTTVVRKAVDLCRPHARSAPLDDVDQPARTPGMAALMDVKEGYLMVCRGIARLPERQREAVALRHIAGLPAREVAELMGVKESTVRVLLSQARRTLAPLSAELRRMGLLDGEEGEEQ
ncbi:RNA polymerase sigma factor [Streptomyces sp. NRRL B-1347]|uniref:RNA polymerase sigma factor n=1 Tax=Streptomyces sp. NRRL B-1347 TaxID=1476877 RepID=UPI000689BF3F|nr:sigma-70 family RNA polymerase sigma factor [Streptomyces sp. NRRL B-1347]